MEEIPPEIEQGEDELRRCIARAVAWDASCEQAAAQLAGAMVEAGIPHKEMIRRFRALRLSRRGAAKLISDARRVQDRQERRDAHPETGTGLAWPDVIGVLSIVVGAKWLLWPWWEVRAESLDAFLKAQSLTAFLSRLPIRSLPSLIGLATVAGGVVEVGWLLLVVAGLMLWRRRRTGALLHAVAGCIVCLGTIVSQAAWYGHLGTKFWSGRGDFLILRAITIAAVLSYPTFVLIWFRRRPIRQQVRRWRMAEGRLDSRAARPVWPLALGAVSVVLAAMRIISSAWLWFLWTVIRHQAQWASAEWRAKVVVPVLTDALELPLLVVLVVAGALLIRKARSAIVLHWVYAFLAVLHVFAMATVRAWLTFGYGRDPWSTFVTRLYALIAMVAFRLAYPVFLLVWFGRASIRRQAREW